MAVPTLTQFPLYAIQAGETLRVQRGYGQYPATSWTAVLYLNQAGAAPTSVSGSASGTDFVFVVPAATTLNLSGTYDIAVKVTESSSGEVGFAESGTLTFLASPASTITQSAAQQQLTAANAALLALVSQQQSSASFNGQSFSKENQGVLLSIIRELESIVRLERDADDAARGAARSRSIRPFFV